jgi:hypothetical protein
MEGLHVCRPKKSVFKGGKCAPDVVRKNKKQHAKVSAFQQDIITFSHKWASLDFTKDSEIETTYLKKPEHTNSY